MSNKLKRKSSTNSGEPLDWNKYTDFRSRHSREHLASLCKTFSKSQLSAIFSSPDQTGLWPIHWAAIHNRSDLIEFLIESGAPHRVRCQNKLFAQGSALHLAAMNGSIEAASSLLKHHEKNKNQQLNERDFTHLSPEGNQIEQTSRDERATAFEKEEPSWLEERDSEGQTALMRSASPRTRRMDTFRDLLRKNLWSLSGRPAEMALFLIHHGAKWRQTEPIYGMNLMHLAIMNNHDDIVFMIMNLDPEMARICVQLPQNPDSGRKSADNQVSSGSDMGPIQDSDVRRPLLSLNDRTDQIISQAKLSPLNMAILYSRVGVIGLLWFASETSQRRSHSDSNLRRVLYRATWTSKSELSRFIRGTLLKLILACDFILLALIWIPVYLFDRYDSLLYRIIGASFVILSYFLSLVAALRVVMRSPGYLRRNTSQYYAELSRLVKESTPTPASIQQEAEPKQVALISLNDSVSISMNEDIPDCSVEERVRLLCHKCRCIRKLRSRHCNYCDHCIQDFDHHCIYLGCCIGRQNRLDFLVMMFALVLLGINGLMFQMSANRTVGSAWSFFGAIWIGKYLLIGSICAFSILRRATLGVTMYEQVRSQRIRHIFGLNGPPEAISRSHRVFSTFRNSFWRFAPSKYLVDGQSARQMRDNLNEFANHTKMKQYLLDLFCSDSCLSRSHSNGKRGQQNRAG